MAADAYKGVVTLEYLTRSGKGWARSGRTQQFRFSADDVAGNKLSFDGTGETNITIAEPAILADISTTEDGADTVAIEMFENGVQSPYVWLIANLLNTTPQPHILPGSRPVLKPGLKYQFFQRA